MDNEEVEFNFEIDEKEPMELINKPLKKINKSQKKKKKITRD